MQKTIKNYQFRTDTKKYRNDCKACCQIRINTYRRENEEYKTRYNQYRKNRRLSDIQFAIMDRLRARVRKMLNADNSSKYFSTIDLLGCSMDKFQEHLISKFYGDMSWEKKKLCVLGLIYQIQYIKRFVFL